MAKEVSMEFAFFEFLRSFYLDNKGIIRNRYREITKKYLDYNDKEKNPDAFLRKPQFEALEMYVFVKEFRVCQVKCVNYFIFLSVVVIATDFYCAIRS